MARHALHTGPTYVYDTEIKLQNLFFMPPTSCMYSQQCYVGMQDNGAPLAPDKAGPTQFVGKKSIEQKANKTI